MTRLAVTGSTNGIGLAITQALAAQNNHVIMVVRDTKRGHELRHTLAVQHPEAEIDVVECNLASRGSIDSCADVIQRRYGTLDVLINNAGRMIRKGRISPRAATNLPSPPIILDRFSSPIGCYRTLTHDGVARVVVVASALHAQGVMDFDHLTNTHNYTMMRAYARSKLANVMFANALARRCEDTNIRVNSLHPGVISSNIMPSDNVLWRIGARLGGLLGILKPPERGAKTPLYLALDDAAADMQGLYLDEHQIPQACAPQASSVSLQERLWGISTRATGIS